MGGFSEPSVLAEDGAWCWFQGPRAVGVRGSIVVGSVASGWRDPSRRGTVQATTVDLASGRVHTIDFDRCPDGNDHCSPALLELSDRRVLAVWTRHGSDDLVRSAVVITPDHPTDEPVPLLSRPWPGERLTYSNLIRLGSEGDLLYDIVRGPGWKPSVAVSRDGGSTWEPGGVLVDVPGEIRHRPYVRCHDDGRQRIDLLFTDGHPSERLTSVFHAYYERGLLHRSDGTVIGPLDSGIADPSNATLVLEGSPHAAPWLMDLTVDAAGRPAGLVSIRIDASDHRYVRLAWDGHDWTAVEIAFGGRCLYDAEADYTGLAAFVPSDPGAVYLATDAHPVTGVALTGADGARHWEIWRGETDGGGKWSWTPVTTDSTIDNLRPVTVGLADGRHALLWLRGEYRTYIDHDLEVVGLFGLV